MSRTRLLFIALPAIVIASLQSCAKKEKAETPSDRLRGSWKLARIATDDNANGAIDESEKRNVPTAQDYELTFKGDNTGVEHDVYGTDSTIPLYFHWALGKDNLWIAYALHDTITYTVVDLSASGMTLQNSTPNGLAWSSYNRK